MNGVLCGTVWRDGAGTLGFEYDSLWSDDPQAYPLSLSMPLAHAWHGDHATRTWLWGLLPESTWVLEAWARSFGVSRTDVVGLLTHVGADCAGAVQFVPPAVVEQYLGEGPEESRAEIDWLSEDQVADRLTQLRNSSVHGRLAQSPGQFSLAGVQPKIALYESDNGRLGIPHGRWPTNRILKPPVLDVAHLAWNEHFCLALAGALGLRAATTHVRHFGDVETIVVERYDRLWQGARLLRVHQEDCCQLLSVPSERKYESQGGPDTLGIARALQTSSSAPVSDVESFLDAQALNWLAAGTDAHAKNFSVLHASGGQLRLAPLYDVISLAPYPELLARDATLAMSIGGERRLDAIDETHWRALANALGLEAGALVARVAALGERLGGATERVLGSADYTDQSRAILEQLAAAVIMHARRRLDRLALRSA